MVMTCVKLYVILTFWQKIILFSSANFNAKIITAEVICMLWMMLYDSKLSDFMIQERFSKLIPSRNSFLEAICEKNICSKNYNYDSFIFSEVYIFSESGDIAFVQNVKSNICEPAIIFSMWKKN